MSALKVARELVRQRRREEAEGHKPRQYGIPLTVRFALDAYSPLIRCAIKHDISASEIIRRLVGEWIAKGQDQ